MSVERSMNEQNNPISTDRLIFKIKPLNKYLLYNQIHNLFNQLSWNSQFFHWFFGSVYCSIEYFRLNIISIFYGCWSRKIGRNQNDVEIWKIIFHRSNNTKRMRMIDMSGNWMKIGVNKRTLLLFLFTLLLMKSYIW